MTNKIVLKGDPIQKEGTAGEVIKPGHLIEFAADGDLQKHATAGGNARAAFAVENDQLGDGIDDDYANAAEVKYVVGRPGDELYAILEDGHEVSKGDPLESAGDGTLQPWNTEGQATDPAATPINTDSVVAYAAEDVDTSGTPTATSRIRIEVA